MFWGTWFGKNDKYIGVRLNNSEFPRLGWVKISLPTIGVHSGQKLIVEEFGYVP